MTNAVATNGRGEPQESKRARSREDGGWTRIEQGQFCVSCGAWLGCLGLEPTPDLYIAHLVLVFEEVRRVLRRDGTLWLNLGDCYAQSGGNGKQGETSQRLGRSNAAAQQKRGPQAPPPGLKAKDLCMIPARVALALQASGWYLRSDIIWSKTNPMPESTQDRPTKSHEYVFLLAKSEKYFYDAEAIREGDSGKSAGNKEFKVSKRPRRQSKPEQRASRIRRAIGRWSRPQSSFGLDNLYRPIPRRSLCDVPSKTRRAVHPGQHISAWLLLGVWVALQADRKERRAARRATGRRRRRRAGGIPRQGDEGLRRDWRPGSERDKGSHSRRDARHHHDRVEADVPPHTP